MTDTTLIAISPAEYNALREWATRGIKSFAHQAHIDNAALTFYTAIDYAKEAGLEKLAEELREEFING